MEPHARAFRAGAMLRRMIERALHLARLALPDTPPNPAVGCVLVGTDGGVIGEGRTQAVGGPHAEIMALRDAQARGRSTVGATAYVTLEPCAHHGRTGPCCEALAAAGIARVVASLEDPNPQVAGQGFARLRAAGVEVAVGPGAAEAREITIGFLSRMARGLPWVRMKAAASLDGRTALPDGTSQWITGEAARADVQRWRARSGALLTGAGTVLADDPHLTVRLDDGSAFVPPLRVVLDAGLATLGRGRVREGGAPTLYLHAPDAKLPRGLAIEHAPAPVHGARFDLDAVLRLLAARGINEVQVEAGATLAGAFLAAGLVDELLLYIAPVLLGDAARPLFSGLSVEHMAQRFQLQSLDCVPLGSDLRVRLRPLPRDGGSAA